MREVIYDIHLASTAIMTGVIWFVQLIHYRWFHDVPSASFTSYHHKYTATVGLIVGPAMMAEFTSALYLLFFSTGAVRTMYIIGMALIIIIWLSTALFQVPCHNKLASGYDPVVHRKLVRTNWIRTIGWTARLVLIIAGGVLFGRG